MLYFEVYILAGKSDAGGLILAGDDPATIQDIAYLLRRSADQVNECLTNLVNCGLVELDDDQVTVCRFAGEQGPSQAEKRRVWARDQQNKRDRANGKDQTQIKIKKQKQTQKKKKIKIKKQNQRQIKTRLRESVASQARVMQESGLTLLSRTLQRLEMMF